MAEHLPAGTYAVNQSKLDELALTYADTGDELTLYRLTQKVQRFLRNEAYNAARRAMRTGVYIAREEFESAYNHALFDASQGYDGSSPFGCRLRYYMQRHEAQVWRDNSYQENKEKKYARLYSYDRAITPQGEGEKAISDLLFGEVAGRATEIEDKCINEVYTEKMLADFGEVNKQYLKIIKLLRFGCTKLEIALAFGESKYHGKISKRVQRAKKAFKHHYENYFAAEAS